ncbi:MAG TPA: hypothetical protein VMB50_16765 [Myxococcales bacterium]|nr:hypothetical protein [Myxococcales bacterium]
MDDRSPKSWPLPFEDPPILDLEASFCSLTVEPVDAGEVPSLAVASGRGPFRDDPDAPVTVEEAGGVVRVRIGGRLGWPPWGRKAVFRLRVPRALRARLHCDAGLIVVERLAGCDLEMSAGAGHLRLDDVHGRLALRADAGQIRGERLGGSLEVESSAGEVRLGVDSLDPGTHRIHTSMGAVRLELAPGLRVRIEARTSMGSTRNRYPTTPDAEAILSLETDLGSVRIDPGGPPAPAGVDDWRSRWSGKSAGRWPVRPAPPAASPGPPRPSIAVSDDELKRVLQLVEQGKINAEQADRLIRAMEGR